MRQIDHVPRDAWAAAAEVARLVELETVAMTEGSFGLRIPHGEEPKDSFGLKLDRNVVWDLRGRQLFIRPSFVVEATEAAPGPGIQRLPSFTIRAAFLLVYQLMVDPPPEDRREFFLGAFSRINGTFVVWPYLREFVQASSSRMGLPPLVLPVYQVRSEEDGQAGDQASVATSTTSRPRSTKPGGSRGSHAADPVGAARSTRQQRGQSEGVRNRPGKTKG